MLDKVSGVVLNNMNVLASAPDVSGLRGFLQGDGTYLVGVVAAFLIIKEWRQGNLLKAFMILIPAVIIVGLFKGSEILNWFAGLLNLIGINTGG